MNFWEAKFSKNKIDFGKQDYPVPPKIREKLEMEGANEVYLGIRPEHIMISPESHNHSYEIELTVIEFLGSETMVTFEFPDGISGMVSVPGFYEAKISFPFEKIHVFDKETEINLIHKK